MKRRIHSADFKFKAVVEALKEICTLEELGTELGVAPSQISRWLKEFKDNGKNIFLKDKKATKKMELLEKEQSRLYGIVGEFNC